MMRNSKSIENYTLNLILTINPMSEVYLSDDTRKRTILLVRFFMVTRDSLLSSVTDEIERESNVSVAKSDRARGFPTNE